MSHFADIAGDRLDHLTVDELRQQFHLTQYADGSFRHHLDEGGKAARLFVLLPVGEFLPWQKRAAPFTVTHIAGAPLAVSRSADGHHADAMHLENSNTIDIGAACWHTLESLGRWSFFEMNVPSEAAELAPDDWFPTPLAGAMGNPQGLA